MCSTVNYTVVIEESTRMIVEQRVVTSDSCRNGLCSSNFTLPADQDYFISVRASNAIASSNSTMLMSCAELPTKQGLLGAGVSVLIIVVLFYILMIVCTAVQCYKISSKCEKFRAYRYIYRKVPIYIAYTNFWGVTCIV